MVDRYLAIVLARPGDETAMQRLLEHASHLPEGVRGLEQALQARRAESLNMRLLLAGLAHARGDDASARLGIEEAIAMEPTRVEPYRLLARIERSGGNLEAARVALSSAARRAPGEEAVLRELAGLLMDLNRFDEARSVYASLPHASPWEQTEYVRLLATRGHCAEALPWFHEAEDASLDATGMTSVLLLRAQCEDAVDDGPSAQASLTRALGPARRAGRNLEVLDAMLGLARRRGTLEALVSVLTPLGASARSSLGMVFEELGRDSEARHLYAQHLRSNARDAEVRVRLVHLLARSGELEAALEERRTLARLFPDRLAFTLEVAEALTSLGRPEEATRILDAARARGRHDPGTLRRVLDAYGRMGDRVRALATLEDLVREDPSDVSRVTALASELIARGEQARALQLIASLAAEGTVEGELAAGRACLDVRLLEASRAHLERAIALEPEDPRVLDASAELYERLGRPSDAQRVWEARLTGLAPNDPTLREVEARLVSSWARAGVLAQQVQPLSQRAEAGDSRALYLLAEVQRRLGDGDAALASLMRLEALAPDDANVVTSLQRLHHARHDYDGEVRALRRLVELEPSRAGWHWSQLLELAFSMYRDADALRFADAAGSRAFNDATLAIRLGRLEARRHELERASALYRRALEVDPDAHEAAWELASLEEGRGHMEEATRLYASIVERASEDELRDRAAQASLESARASNTLHTLEPRFLALALAHGDSEAHRRPALILYTALLRELERSAPDAVERAATRALPVLLAGVRDSDASHRAMSQSILLRHPVRGAAAPLLALAGREGSEVSLRRAAAFAALRVLEPGNESALRALLVSPDARLRIAGLHGLSRLLSTEDFRTLLNALHEHEDLELRAHAAWWSALTTQAGRPLPSWSAALRRDDPAQPEAARLRALALMAEPTTTSLDWLASRVLSRESPTRPRDPFLVHVEFSMACAPPIEMSEALDAWLSRAIAGCPARPRSRVPMAESLERAALRLPATALATALTRIAELAEQRPEVAVLAARAVHSRLSTTPSLRDAQRDLRLIRSAPESCDAACWDRYAAHPMAEIRAAAIAGAPLERVLALRDDSSWLVRRARVLRLREEDPAANIAQEARIALEDESLYVRRAALELLSAHLDAETCAAVQSRAAREVATSLQRALTQALGACNGRD